MKLPSIALATLLLTPSPRAFAATLRGADDKEDVYKLKPRDVSDEQLKDLVIEPSLRIPSNTRTIRHVPEDLSDDPFDPNFVFEGYLETSPTKTQKQLEAKRKKMQDYYFSLDDDELQELESRLEKRRVQIAKKTAAARGVPFDERKQVAIAITDDGQVWSLRADDFEENAKGKQDLSFKNETSQFVGTKTTKEDPADTGTGPSDSNAKERGIGLDLVSGYNGNDMTSFPWTTQGCLSTKTSTDGCFCSGTKISARLVLTAGHCLSEGDGTFYSNLKYWLPGADGVDKRKNGNDDTPNGAKGFTTKFVDTAWFYNEVPHRDWALLVLNPYKSNCDLGWLGYRVAPSISVVNIYGYPGQGTCEASPFSSKLCHNSIYGDSKEIKAQFSTSFQYNIDTQGGMSGSGVYEYTQDPENRQVVGIHVRGLEQSGTAVKVNDDIFNSIQEVRAKYPDSSAC